MADEPTRLDLSSPMLNQSDELGGGGLSPKTIRASVARLQQSISSPLPPGQQQSATRNAENGPSPRGGGLSNALNDIMPRAKEILKNMQLRDPENNQLFVDALQNDTDNDDTKSLSSFRMKKGNQALNNLKGPKRREFWRRGRNTTVLDQYSEGESGSEFPVKFKMLKKNRKIQRLVFLWKKAFVRSLICAKMVYASHAKHQIMLRYGSNIHLFDRRNIMQSFRKKKFQCVILPDHRLKGIWTGVVIVLLIYTAIFVPFKIAFHLEETQALSVVDTVVDVLFFIDIIVNFLSATETKSGKLITDIKTIAKMYLKGWFLFDLIACIPFDSFLNSNANAGTGSNSNELVRMLRLPRLYRLVRLMRLVKMLRILKNSRMLNDLVELIQVTPAVTRLLKTLFGVVYLVHLFACIWFFTASFTKSYDNWVDMLGLWDEPAQYQYLVSVYWCLQTVTTVGFGDIGITYLEEYLLVIFWMLFGVSVYTFTIGIVSNIITAIDQQATNLSQKIQTLQSYSLKISLPPEVALRIQRFLENDSKDLNSLDEQELMIQQLPPSLRNEVVEFASERIVKELPFFKNLPIDFQHKVLPLLKARQLYAGDILFSEGDVAEEIIFVIKGNFDYYKDISDMISLPDQLIDIHRQAFNVPFAQYVRESYFGDEDTLFSSSELNSSRSSRIGVLIQDEDNHKCFRAATAVCVDDAEVLVIKRRQISEELNRFRPVGKLMKEMASEKREYHKILINSILNRYRNADEMLRQIAQRMGGDSSITTHMSLKQALRKNKERARLKSQMPASEQPLVGMSPRSSQNEDYQNDSDNDQNPNQQVQTFQDVPEIDIIGNRVAAVFETYTTRMKLKIKQALAADADIKNQPGQFKDAMNILMAPSPLHKSLRGHGQDHNLDAKVADLFDEGETYMEKTMNAAANNMSMLTLHSVEVANHFVKERLEQQTQEKVIQNIEGHAKFMADKSDKLRARLEQAALKYGYRQ